MTEKIRMRRVSCYFLNGTAQAFVQRVEEEIFESVEHLKLKIGEDRVVIRKEALGYWREQTFLLEVKDGSAQLAAAEPEDRPNIEFR